MPGPTNQHETGNNLDHANLPLRRPALNNFGMSPPNDFDVVAFNDLHPELKEFVSFVRAHKVPSRVGVAFKGLVGALSIMSHPTAPEIFATVVETFNRSVALGSPVTLLWLMNRRMRLAVEGQPNRLVLSDERFLEKVGRLATDFEFPYMFSHMHTKFLSRAIARLASQRKLPFNHPEPEKFLTHYNAVSIDNDGNLYFTKNPLDKDASSASPLKQLGRIIAWYSPFQRSRSFLKPLARRSREKASQTKAKASSLRLQIAPGANAWERFS